MTMWCLPTSCLARIKQWWCLLFCASSKIKLVQFMLEDWKRPHLKEKLEGKVIYVTCGDNCFKVNTLKKVQDEVNTHMLLHAKHAAADYDSIIIVANDTYVLKKMSKKCVQLSINMCCSVGNAKILG